MSPRCAPRSPRIVGPTEVRGQPSGVRLADDRGVRRQTDAGFLASRYRRGVNWFERLLDWMRKLNPVFADGVLAVAFTVVGLISVFNQDRRPDHLTKPGALAVLTIVATCAPVVVRRRVPLPALAIGCAAITVHEFSSYPEGSLPITVMLLTYTVAAWESTRRAVVGLAIVVVTLLAIVFTPGLDLAGLAANMAFFAVGWSIGYAVRSRRERLEATVREAQERAQNESQRTARLLAEERLRIAQELHDVVAHSMSVIAVQAGVGSHVLDAHPEQTRLALEAISATSRGTLNELRRLLGVLRDNDGARSHAPAPALADLPHLVDDVRAAGVPVALHVVGSPSHVNTAVELSAYRVVQEALTNVIKHAGSPSHVDVNVRYLESLLVVEVVDDGRGAASLPGHNGSVPSGHGLLGMRERVDVWGGELSTAPIPGGGFRVTAKLPYGAPT